MDFVFGDTIECADVKLEPLSKKYPEVDIEYLEFSKSFTNKIEDILNKGVRYDNQELKVNTIIMTRDNYNKMGNYGYKAYLDTIADTGGNNIGAFRLIFGNIHIHFDNRYVKYNGDTVIIKNAEMIALDSGDYTYIELHDD